MKAKASALLCSWIFSASFVSADSWGYLFELRTLTLHTLTGESLQIGRLPQSHIVLSNSQVSRRHAEIRMGSEGLVLVDLGSTNGTRVNHRALSPGRPVLLQPGDVLEFGPEKLLFHKSESALWEDALLHLLLGQVVHLQVAVEQDRRVRSLGVERIVPAESRAFVEPVGGGVQMSYPARTAALAGFAPGEPAYVGNVLLSDGRCRLSLWGLERSERMVSRRASLSYLKHGDLLVGLAGESLVEARRRFEEGWSSDGVLFLLPLLDLVIERPDGSRSAIRLPLELLTNLLEQEGDAALRDATRSLEFLHRIDPENSEVPVLAARAGARRVETMARTRRGVAAGTDLAELDEALASAKRWLQKAIELGAEDGMIEKAESEIAEAEKRLGRAP